MVFALGREHNHGEATMLWDNYELALMAGVLGIGFIALGVILLHKDWSV